MSYSWESADAAAPRATDAADRISDGERRRLEAIADLLIPAGAGMPPASGVGVGRRQLDIVVRSRPDLIEPLRKALRRIADHDGDLLRETDDWITRMYEEDPEAYHALTTVILAGYYLSDEVKDLLGYPGQKASVVTIGYPEYASEGLLDAVLERGPRYREPPPDRS